MTGRTLDAYKQVPKFLWAFVGAQLGVTPPDMGTLGALYDGRTDTLVDHQMLAYQALGFSPMAEHQRRYVTRWIKERLSQPSRSDLLHELKRWLYEHRILIPHDRALKRLISQAVEACGAALTEALLQAYGEASLDALGTLLPRPEGDRTSLQQWL